MITIKSSRDKDLYFTYTLAELSFSYGAVIILDGLPSRPASKDQLIKKLSGHGFDVFFPRYEGTWESKGEFLKRPPSQGIIEFIEALRKGVSLNDKKYFARKIFLLGSSFGGGVALDVAAKGVADKTCALSPVISFRRVPRIKTLEDYLRTAYSKDYRFNSKNWQKLLEDRLWNLDSFQIKNPSDVLIMAGNVDEQIKKADLIKFGKKNKIRVNIYNFGHITLSKITESILEEIRGFFS